MVGLRDKNMIPKNKGDYMFLSRVLDDGINIKEMDAAIPLQASNEMRAIGINPSNYVMMYWKDGKQELVNIVAHWAVLKNSN